MECGVTWLGGVGRATRAEATRTNKTFAEVSQTIMRAERCWSLLVSLSLVWVCSGLGLPVCVSRQVLRQVCVWCARRRL